MDVAELVAQLTPEQLAKIIVEVHEKSLDDGWQVVQIIEERLDDMHFNWDGVLK